MRKKRFYKYGHIIYQSIANFMYFQKNIRAMCLKPTENPPQESITPWGLTRGWNMKVFIPGHVTYQSVANFVYCWKSRKTVCRKWNIKSPQSVVVYIRLLGQFQTFFFFFSTIRFTSTKKHRKALKSTINNCFFFQNKILSTLNTLVFVQDKILYQMSP